MTRLEQLALNYHKHVEGEYGCGYPQTRCPGVVRLLQLLESALVLRDPFGIVALDPLEEKKK